MDYDSLLCRLFFKDTKFGKRLNGKIKTYNYKIQQNKLNNIQSYLVNRYNDWTNKHQYSVNETHSNTLFLLIRQLRFVYLSHKGMTILCLPSLFS